MPQSPGPAIEHPTRAWTLAAALSLPAAMAVALCVIAQAIPLVVRFRDVFPFADMVDVVYRYFVGPTQAFWIYHDNDHLPLFVMPLYWIDLRLFHAQGTFLIACNILLTLLIALAPAPALVRALPGRRLAASSLIAVIVSIYFWLGNYVDLTWPKQVHMYLALFAVMMAIALAASVRPATRLRTWAIAAWLIIATFSFGYGIAGFPVILAIGVLRRQSWRAQNGRAQNWRDLTVVGAAFVLCLGVYVATASKALMVDSHTTALIHAAGHEALYALTFVAGPPFHILQHLLPRQPALGIAWSLSVAGMLIVARQGIRHLRQPPGELGTWSIGLALFTIIVAGMTAYARAQFGYFQAADDRYVIGQLPFWVGLLLIAVAHSRATPRRMASLGLALVLVCTGLLISQAAMLPALRSHNHDRWASAMSAIDNVGDPQVYIRDNIFHTDRVAAIIEGLRARRWAAFAWPQTAWIGRPIGAFGAVQGGCVGAIDVSVAVGGAAGHRVEGWAADSRLRDRSLWIALADGSGIIRGLAHAGGPRPDVAGTLHSPDLLYSGWTGYVPAPFSGEPIAAYLLVHDKHPCRIGAPA